MQMSGFDKYFLEMSAHCLLKIAFKDSSSGKKPENLAFLGYFPEAKTEECNQNIKVSAIDFALSYLV